MRHCLSIIKYHGDHNLRPHINKIRNEISWKASRDLKSILKNETFSIRFGFLPKIHTPSGNNKYLDSPERMCQKDIHSITL